MISVIIPVYNVKNYLEKSLRSILNQTYRNLEIIVVDDGSTDGSSGICDKIATEDERVTVIHKSNGGQGSARNVALDIAQGQFICFLDSDDSAKPDYVEFLYEMIHDKEIDVAACNNEMYGANGSYLKKRKDGIGYVELTGIETIYSLWTQGVINIAPWGKLFKKELWNGIRFKECFSEDWATMHYVYEKANKIGFSYECKVEYLVRESSSIREFNDKKLVMVEIAADNLKFAEKYPELLPAARQKAVSVYFHVLFQLPKEKRYSEIRRAIKKLIRRDRFKVLKDRKCINKTRCALVLSLMGYWITDKALKLIHNNNPAY